MKYLIDAVWAEEEPLQFFLKNFTYRGSFPQKPSKYCRQYGNPSKSKKLSNF